MADATAVQFQTETPAKAKAAAHKLIADEAALKVAAPQADPSAPKPGDTFVPVRGKVGVWHGLGGEAAGIAVPVITH